MANSFWMATAEGSGGRANGSRGRDQPISFHTSEKTDPISTALPKSQFNFHRPWARTRCEYWLWASFMQRRWNAATSPFFFFFGVFSSKHTGFNSKRCLLIRRILVTEKGTAVKLGHLLDAGHTLSSVGAPVPKKHAATIYHMSLAKRLPGINFCLLKKEELRSILQVKSRNPGPLPYGQGVGHKIRWHCKAAGGVWTLRFPRKCPGFEK